MKREGERDRERFGGGGGVIYPKGKLSGLSPLSPSKTRMVKFLNYGYSMMFDSNVRNKSIEKIAVHS